MRCHWTLILMFVALVLPAGADDQPIPKPPDLSDVFGKCLRLRREARQLREAGKEQEAGQLYIESLDYEQKITGRLIEEATLASAATAASQRAMYAQFDQDYNAMAESLAEVVRLNRELYGDQHWRVTLARGAVARARGYSELKPNERTRLWFAESKFKEASAAFDLGRYEQALNQAGEAAAVFSELRGESSQPYAASLELMGLSCAALGRDGRAETLLRQAVRLNRETLGPKDPHYAESLYRLAVVLINAGEDRPAEPLLIEAADILEHHGSFLTQASAMMQALLEVDDDTPKKRDRRRHSWEPNGPGLTAIYPSLPLVITRLASLYHLQNRRREAADMYARMVELYNTMESFDVEGYVAGMESLADFYLSGEHPDEAGKMLEEAQRMRRGNLGVEHPLYSAGQARLAQFHAHRGRLDQAESLLRQALETTRFSQGENHPDVTRYQFELALLAWQQGDRAGSGESFYSILSSTREKLAITFDDQSERRQLALLRDLRLRLDVYLSWLDGQEGSDENAYRHVLAWKGAVFARQRRQRELRNRHDLSDTFQQLSAVAANLASLQLKTPAPDERKPWFNQLEKLAEDKRQLESKLSQSVLDEWTNRPLGQMLAELRSALPPRTVLIDFLQYVRWSPPCENHRVWQREDRITAFVVRHATPVIQIDLGPATPIASAVKKWRAELKGESGPESRADRGLPISGREELMQLMWHRLLPHLQGATTIFISPDLALSRCPWNALPGWTPSSYLIEDATIAIVPVPALLSAKSRERVRKNDFRELLTIGGVDFSPESTTSIDSSLPGSLDESLAIRALFQRMHPHGQVTALVGADATEAAFRARASGHDVLHLATHGFFAPSNVSSVLANPQPLFLRERSMMPAVLTPRLVDWSSDAQNGIRDRLNRAQVEQVTCDLVTGSHPGLLSGIVFAKSDSLPAASYLPEISAEDGVLTALEVAELDLNNTRLAVLSACETGLGEMAGGEGVLGLQRGFQLAGVDSTVTSLWAVDDRATEVLMKEFYSNMWERDMGSLQALRNAQLALLRGQGPGDSSAPRYWAAWHVSVKTANFVPLEEQREKPEQESLPLGVRRRVGIGLAVFSLLGLLLIIGRPAWKWR